MLDLFRRLITDEEGQGMVEYGLIIALISIAVLVFLPGIGDKLKDVFGKVKGELDKVDTD